MAQQDFAIKETTQVASEGILLQTVATSITNIVSTAGALVVITV